MTEKCRERGGKERRERVGEKREEGRLISGGWKERGAWF
jgi:hypothetical protein